MEVWQHKPQNGVVESLEWLTDVIRCKSAEYRLCLRSVPRQGFSLQHRMVEAEYGLAREKARVVGGDPLFVPDWPRLAAIPAINIGTVTLPVDADHAPSIKVGGSVLIVETFDHFEVCTIADIGVGTITISATTQSYSYPVVVPLRVGTFAQAFAGTRIAARQVNAHALFTITATEDMVDTTAVAYPTYLTLPLVTAPRELINNSEDSVTNPTEPFDSRIGGVVNYALQSAPSVAMGISITAQTAQQFIDLRSFLATVRGRWKHFWLPSGNRDFTLTKDIASGDGFIQVAAVDFANTYGVGTDVVVITKAGYHIPLRVTSVTPEAPSSERLNFAGAFSGALAMSLVDKVCKLTLSRLDADRIELQYMPGLATTVVVSTIEVPA